MAKLPLNKSSLQKQRDDMRLFQRLLPSLELKRMQLSAEFKRAQERLAADQAEVEQLRERDAALNRLADSRFWLIAEFYREQIARLEKKFRIDSPLEKLARLKDRIQEFNAAV